VHIIAVSGYNLTIILRAGMRLFGKRSKYQTMLYFGDTHWCIPIVDWRKSIYRQGIAGKWYEHRGLVLWPGFQAVDAHIAGGCDNGGG
jgi:hypothetical protein